MIQPIVEGQGEVESVPILLRRVLGALGVWNVKVGKPRRCPRQQIVRKPDLERMVEIATQDDELQAILILFDLDDDCARSLIPSLMQWCKEMPTNVPCAIVLPRREYEAWFLAAIDSLHGKCEIPLTATYEGNPETKRGAKEALSLLMPKNRPYSATADQPKMTAVFDMGMAYKRTSSFRKLVSELCRVLMELGYQPTIPDDWKHA